MFKVAILQKRSINEQIDKNIETIIMAMEEASENHADILLLPECFITGYDLPMSYEKSIADNDIRIAKICENAKKYKIGVVLTAFTKGSKQPQNSAFVINKSGNILMKYSKVHTCDFADERDVESGKEFKVCDFEGIQLGIMICYDREFPESARILMLKGAEVILVPNDCGSMQPRIMALSTRAYENMVAVAMANPNGDNAGCSCAYSPICWDRNGKCVDNTVLLADDKTEGIFYAEFDMEAIREYRNREMLGNTFRKLERAVTGYFDYIEDLIERENVFTMEEFSKSVNEFLAFRRYDILKDNGRVSHKQAVEKAYQEYDIFNKTQPIESDFDKIVKGLEKKE